MHFLQHDVCESPAKKSIQSLKAHHIVFPVIFNLKAILKKNGRRYFQTKELQKIR